MTDSKNSTPPRNQHQIACDRKTWFCSYDTRLVRSTVRECALNTSLPVDNFSIASLDESIANKAIDDNIIGRRLQVTTAIQGPLFTVGIQWR
jgi:hypothetical protein